MIKEKYVSFEIAKSLYENDFDAFCDKVWLVTKLGKETTCDTALFVEGEIRADRETVKTVLKREKEVHGSEAEQEAYLAPTYQMVIDWLREEKELLVSVNPTIDKDGNVCITYYIWDLADIDTEAIRSGLYSIESYHNCLDDAIKYCIENLI